MLQGDMSLARVKAVPMPSSSARIIICCAAVSIVYSSGRRCFFLAMCYLLYFSGQCFRYAVISQLVASDQ